MDVKHTELPCFYDDRDKGWGGRKQQIIVPHKEQVGVE